MPLVHVAIQEGFQDDTLVVHWDGAEVYRRAGVKTRTQIGLADDFELDVASGAAELWVEVPTRNASATLSVEVPSVGDLHVGISLDQGGAIACHSTGEPFRYA